MSSKPEVETKPEAKPVTRVVRSATKPVVQSPVPAAVSHKAKMPCEKTWDEIKNKHVEMFSLPSKPITDYCKPVLIDPNKLYLTATTTAFLPALEATLSGKYSVELVDKMILVTKI